MTNSASEINQILSITQAAEYLDVSRKTLRRWEKKGVLTPQKTAGGYRRYPFQLLQEFKNLKGKRRVTKSSPARTFGANDTPTPLPALEFEAQARVAANHTSPNPQDREVSPSAGQVPSQAGREYPEFNLHPPTTSQKPFTRPASEALRAGQPLAHNPGVGEFDPGVMPPPLFQPFHRHQHRALKYAGLGLPALVVLFAGLLAQTSALRSPVRQLPAPSAQLGQVLAASTLENTKFAINVGSIFRDQVLVDSDVEITGTGTIPTLIINEDTITDLTGAGILAVNGVLQTTLGDSISGEEIDNASLLALNLSTTNDPTDNLILSYDATTGGFTWVADQEGETPSIPAALWTDSGSLTYLAATTNDLAIGGSTTAAPFYFDTSAGTLTLDTDLQIGAIALSDVGTSSITSGATLIGVYDELATSDSTTLQDVLDDMDAAITGGGGGVWSRDAINGYIYPTTLGDYVGIGTTTPQYPIDIEEGLLGFFGTQILRMTTDATTLFGFPGRSIILGNGGTNLTDDSYSGSILIGYNAGSLLTNDGTAFSGNWNVAIGTEALKDNISGNQNVAVGNFALSKNTANANTAFGHTALYSNTTGIYNVATGFAALTTNTTGSRNVATGLWALEKNTTGSNNIALGHQAGNNITTGSNNIIIGYDLDAPSATGSNQLYLGGVLYGDLSTGYLGIGTTSPSSALDVIGGLEVSGTPIFTGIASGGSNTTVLALDGSNNVDYLDISGYDTNSSDDLSYSLTAGYVPYANTTTSLANSGIYFDGTNIGIGTATPTSAVSSSKFIQLKGSNPRIEIEATGASDGTGFVLIDPDNTWQFSTRGAGSGAFVIRDQTAGANVFEIEAGADASSLTIQSDGEVVAMGGNVGIGTTSPNDLLELLSTSDAQLRLAYDTSNYHTLQVASDGGLTWSGLGTDADLNFDFSGATDGDFSVNSDDLFVDTSTGRVGIGTTGPEFKLSLNSDGGILAKGTVNSGTTLSTAGAGTRMIWYPRKAAFRVGSVSSTQWDDASIGNYSTAMGYNTTASGIFAVAMGYETTASGSDSTAMGVYSTASGDNSTAMGVSTTASGLISTALGSGTTASGFYSTAMGYETTASGQFSTAMGREIEASGDYSFAISLNDQNGTNVTQDNTLAIMGGNVGIGTTAPNDLLELLSTSDAQLRLAYDTSNYSALQVASDGGLTWSGLGTDADLNFDFSGATDGDFSVNSDDLFVDTSTGYVGIGTTSPGAKLNVLDTTYTTSGDKIASFRAGADYPLNITSLGGGVRTGIRELYLGGENYNWVGTIGSTGSSGNETLGIRNNRSGGVQFYNSTNNATVNIDNSGNVGIGTTSPSSALDVIGGLEVSGTPIFTGIASGGSNTTVLALDGSNNVDYLDISGYDTNSSDDLSYSLTAGYVPYANTTTSLANSGIYFDGTNVGIGTTGPAYNLQTYGSGAFGKADTTNATPLTLLDNGEVLSFGRNGGSQWRIAGGSEDFEIWAGNNISGGSGGSYDLSLGATGDIYIGASKAYTGSIAQADNLYFYTSGSERMRVDTNGNVGIGTTSPNDLLELLSTSDAQLRLAYSTSSYQALQVASDGGLTWSALGTDADLNISFSGATDGDFSVNTNDLFVDTSSSDVGIGTTSPSERLHLAGDNKNIKLSSAAIASNSIIFADTADRMEIYRPVSSNDLRIKSRNAGVSDIITFDYDAAYVGIGTTSPNDQLEILSTADAQLRLAYDTSNYHALQVAIDGGLTWSALGTDADLNFDFSGATDGDFSVNSDDLFVDTSTGNVGIGTTGPGYPLTFANVYGSKINFYQGDNIGIAIQNSLVQFVNDTSAGDWTFGYGTTDSLTRLVTIEGTGNVGIGTTSPNDLLELLSTADAQLRLAYSTSSYQALQVASDGGLTWSALGTDADFNISFSGATDGDFSINSDDLFVDTSTGRVGIGGTNPTVALSVVGNGQFSAVTSGTYSADLNLTSSGVLTTASSDIRLKENLVSLSPSESLARVLQLTSYNFNWKENGKHDIGLIAQDVASIIPEIVFTNQTDGYMGINYSRLPIILVSAIQEQQLQLTGLDLSINAQGDAISHLTNDLAALNPGVGEVNPEIETLKADRDILNTNVASISATLANLETNLNTQVDGLDTRLALLEDLVSLMGDTPTATDSATMQNPGVEAFDPGVSEATLSSLTVTNDTLLNNLAITGNTTIGLIKVDGLNSSIRSIGLDPLQIQPNALAGIEFVDAQVTIDTSGNLVVKGNTTIEGDLAVAGSIKGATNTRGINHPITTGETTVTLTFDAPKTTADYAVAITPSWNTSTWITSKTTDSFTINLATPAPDNATLDWIILE